MGYYITAQPLSPTEILIESISENTLVLITTKHWWTHSKVMQRFLLRSTERNFITTVTRARVPLSHLCGGRWERKRSSQERKWQKTVDEPGYSLQQLLLTFPSKSKVSVIIYWLFEAGHHATASPVSRATSATKWIFQDCCRPQPFCCCQPSPFSKNHITFSLELALLPLLRDWEWVTEG